MLKVKEILTLKELKRLHKLSIIHKEIHTLNDNDKIDLWFYLTSKPISNDMLKEIDTELFNRCISYTPWKTIRNNFYLFIKNSIHRIGVRG